MPDMFIRIFAFVSFFLTAPFCYSQTFAGMLSDVNGWRMCGSPEGRDTLVFLKASHSTVASSCENNEYAQLLIDENLSFRLLIWTHEVCFINPGVMELNEDTGEFRFYYDDGSSRDYLMIYLDKKKLVLVDRDY